MHDDGRWPGFFVSRYICDSGFALHLVVFSVFFELECISSWWDLVCFWCLLNDFPQSSLSLNACLHGEIWFVFGWHCAMEADYLNQKISQHSFLTLICCALLWFHRNFSLNHWISMIRFSKFSLLSDLQFGAEFD